MLKTMKSLWRDESGATAIEYGLIAALVSVAAITALQEMGDSLEQMFSAVSDSLDSAVGPGPAPAP
jgi:pilus assembly protein Flp/PilA